MKKINIFYLNEEYQFSTEDIQRHKDNGWLGREPLTLEMLLQLQHKHNYNSDVYDFNIVKNSKIEDLDQDAITIVPIDFQSFPITEEDKTYFTLTEFGKEIDLVIKKVLELPIPNLTFLIYTSTEPYFFDANIYLSELGRKNPNIKIIVSGSGETVDHHGHYKRCFLKTKNLKKISKLWYIDRVQYFSSICQDPELNNIHLDFNKTEIPEPAKNWITSNKFLLTMRNCRTHRLLFGTMWENSKRNLSDTTYGRFYSLLQYALKGLDCSYQEYQYHIDLMTTAMKEINNDTSIPDHFKLDCYKNLLDRPHYIDMHSLNDRGIPGPWLYDLCDFVIAPGGEAYGYGYVDEKQIIPMYFKKPFLTFGCKGLYEELRKIDFKVFDDCWPINFNEEETLYDRVKGAFTVLEYLRTLDTHNWNELMEKAQVSVDFNYELITTGGFRRPSNNNFFEELISYASN